MGDVFDSHGALFGLSLLGWFMVGTHCCSLYLRPLCITKNQLGMVA